MTTRRIRLSQCRDAAGFSQEALAQLLGVNRTTVQRWEKGESEPRQLHRPKLARALGLTRAELEHMIHVGHEPGPFPTTLEEEQHGTLLAMEPDFEGGGDVQRRDFLQGLVVGGLTLAGQLPTAEQPPPLVGLRSAVDRAMRFEQRSQYAALRSTLPSLIAHAEQTALQQEGPDRLEADRLLSKALLVNAFTLIKHDRPADAISAATMALTIAEASGDCVAIGASFRCLSEAHLRGGDYDLAADLGIEGATFIERADDPTFEATAVRGACLLSAATARARDGDRRSAYELLQRAAQQADRLGQEVVGTVVFGPTNVAIHRVAFEVELGDPVQALAYADSFQVEQGRGLEERRSRYLIDVARAQAARRQDAEAIHTLLHAESISPEETRTHRLTRSTLIDLVERRPTRMATGLIPLAQRCGALEAA